MEINYNEEDKIRNLLFGRKVKVEGDTLVLDNGIKLKIVPNEGCGWCGAGDCWINELNEVDNAITDVIFETNDDEDAEQNNYFKIFVFAEDKRFKLLDAEGIPDNGWYGCGYTIEVTKEE